MAGFAQTIIIGNVGRDPETRFLQSGRQVTNFSVAVTKRWNDAATSERRERTTWYRVTCWGPLAETAANYVKKGMQIHVVGDVETRPYLDNAGQPAASLELTAQSFQFLGRRGDNEGASYEDPEEAGAEAADIPF